MLRVRTAVTTPHEHESQPICDDDGSLATGAGSTTVTEEGDGVTLDVVQATVYEMRPRATTRDFIVVNYPFKMGFLDAEAGVLRNIITVIRIHGTVMYLSEHDETVYYGMEGWNRLCRNLDFFGRGRWGSFVYHLMAPTDRWHAIPVASHCLGHNTVSGVAFLFARWEARHELSPQMQASVHRGMMQHARLLEQSAPPRAAAFHPAPWLQNTGGWASYAHDIDDDDDVEFVDVPTSQSRADDRPRAATVSFWQSRPSNPSVFSEMFNTIANDHFFAGVGMPVTRDSVGNDGFAYSGYPIASNIFGRMENASYYDGEDDDDDDGESVDEDTLSIDYGFYDDYSDDDDDDDDDEDEDDDDEVYGGVPVWVGSEDTYDAGEVIVLDTPSTSILTNNFTGQKRTRDSDEGSNSGCRGDGLGCLPLKRRRVNDTTSGACACRPRRDGEEGEDEELEELHIPRLSTSTVECELCANDVHFLTTTAPRRDEGASSADANATRERRRMLSFEDMGECVRQDFFTRLRLQSRSNSPSEVAFAFNCTKNHAYCTGCIRRYVNGDGAQTRPALGPHQHEITCPTVGKCDGTLRPTWLRPLLSTEEFQTLMTRHFRYGRKGFIRFHCRYARCRAMISVPSDAWRDTPAGLLVVHCPTCARRMCAHCEKVCFGSECKRCADGGAFNHAPQATNYYIRRTQVDKNDDQTQNPYLYRNNELTADIVARHLARIIDSERAEVSCPQCNVSLEKSVECNALAHCECEVCYVCGKATSVCHRLEGDHWNETPHTSMFTCPRFDTDDFWKIYCPEYRCREGRCFTDEKRCRKKSHRKGIAKMHAVRKQFQVLHAMASVPPDVRAAAVALLKQNSEHAAFLESMPHVSKGMKVMADYDAAAHCRTRHGSTPTKLCTYFL